MNTLKYMPQDINMEKKRMKAKTKSQFLLVSCLALHCVKSVQIRIFFWSLFSCIRTEYGDLRIRIQIRIGKISSHFKSKFQVIKSPLKFYVILIPLTNMNSILIFQKNPRVISENKRQQSF